MGLVTCHSMHQFPKLFSYTFVNFSSKFFFSGSRNQETILELFTLVIKMLFLVFVCWSLLFVSLFALLGVVVVVFFCLFLFCFLHFSNFTHTRSLGSLSSIVHLCVIQVDKISLRKRQFYSHTTMPSA